MVQNKKLIFCATIYRAEHEKEYQEVHDIVPVNFAKISKAYDLGKYRYDA